MSTSAAWIEIGDRPILGWVTGNAGAAASTVVIAAPIGYEYWSSHRTLRTLAERLAERGHRVVRFDYDGTGDSAGERWDPGRLAAWRASLAAVVERARATGATRITLIGLRLGATLVLQDGAQLGADAVVGWVPVLSGRRFARELRMIGIAVPDRDAVVFAGTGFDAETVAGLEQFDLASLAARPADRVLIVSRPEQPSDALVDRLRQLGSEVTGEILDGAGTALDVPSEDAVVPEGIVARIGDWVGDAGEVAAAPSEPMGPPVAIVPWRGDRLVERVETVAGLVAVRTEPTGPGPAGPTVIFLNSGSEPHIGPGRAWVEYARALAASGATVLRLDWSGWGESVDRDRVPGRPYDAHCIDETVAVVQELRGQGPGPIVLAGLCAGAWAGLRAAQDVPVDGVIAINPQLYWEPGDPVEALMSDTRKRRTASGERSAIADGAASGRWDALDAAGDRPMASRWLDALGDGPNRVLMFFAEGDDGIEYLRLRCGRRLDASLAAGWLEVAEAADFDHQMYREWLRDDAVERFRAFLATIRPAAPG